MLWIRKVLEEVKRCEAHGGVQIYEVAFYVEEKQARAEFKRLEEEGFFKNQDHETFCRALVTGRSAKCQPLYILQPSQCFRRHRKAYPYYQ